MRGQRSLTVVALITVSNSPPPPPSPSPLEGKRKRLPVMAVVDASGGDSSGRGPRVTGGEGSTSGSADEEEHDNFYSVLGLPLAASAAEIKVR